MGITKTSDHIQINIKMSNPSQELLSTTKAPNKDLEDIDVLCNLQDKNLKLRTWVYQRTVTMSKSRSRSQTPVSNFNCPPKPKMRT